MVSKSYKVHVQVSHPTPLSNFAIYMFFKLSLVYDSGSLFSPSVLDITEEDLLKRFISVSCYGNGHVASGDHHCLT